jgi:hypothetical protein
VKTDNTRGKSVGLVALALAVAGCGAPGAGDGGGGDDAELQLAPATSCARPPEGAEPTAVAAYDRVNAYRQAAGLGCMNFSPQISVAAAGHCNYYIVNKGNCVASPHREVMGCDKFRAERFADRMVLAAYPGAPAYETMTYVGAGSQAVDKWVDSVWHRIPILSPWVADAGYGSVNKCDTMDFGWMPTLSDRAPLTYPVDGQTGIPRSFDGNTESPTLPVPPKGWPSGYPIMIYAIDLKVTSHTLVDDQNAPVDHIWIAPEDTAAMGILRNELVMYAHSPLKKATTYHVVIDGEHKGEAVHLAWSFTTR